MRLICRMPYKIALIEDHKLLRDGLKLLLKQEDMTIVAEAGTAEEGIACVEKTRPDLVVLDLNLPDMDGILIIRTLRELSPQTKILVLSAANDSFTINRAIHEGISGYLIKEESMEAFVQALRAISEGKAYLCPVAAAALTEQYRQPRSEELKRPCLSPRESQVLDFIVRGYRNKEIAEQLGVGVKSIDTYRARIMEKTGSSSISELVQYALKTGRLRL